MRKKLIYLISFMLALSLTSLTYGGDVLIGNFEGNQIDGWGSVDPPNPDITLAYSTNGATLDGNSLSITDSTGGSFKRAVTYSMVTNNNVGEFRKHTKVSLDLTRLAVDWGGQWGGWNTDHTAFTGYSEFHMVVEAGSTDANVGKGVWAKGWNLTQISNWGSWNGDNPTTYIYDYSLILNQIDFNNLTYLGIFLATNWGNYTPGGIYYIDNVKLTGGGMAYEPSPANHAVDVQGDPNLIWTPGVGAVTHDVYVGTSFNDVNNASRASHPGLLFYSQSQTSNHCDPGILQSYKTYYWRIDEVNGVNIQKGAVWDFMTSYSGMGVVIGDWENGMNGWEATWQGNTTFSYSTNGATMGGYTLAIQTVKNTDQPQDPGFWIIKRDGVLDLNNMKLQLDVTLLAPEWSGQMVTIGPVVVQTDLPVSWSQYTATGINRKTGGIADTKWTGGGTSAYRTYTFDFSGPSDAPASYTHTDWGDANKMTILIALQNGAQGLGKFYLDDVRLVNVRLAGDPRPANLATDINTTPLLSWKAGKDATSHDVYFGTDATSVSNATTSNPLGVFKGNQAGLTYNPGLLAKNTTYYWRIDERGAPGSPWKGLIWHFTTAEYVLVEDFEIYNNTTNRIYSTWMQGGGGKVGYDSCDFAEVTIIHGGLQSMPFDYNNVLSPFDSNAARTFTSPQDWTVEGVKSLELWYRGWPATVGSFTGADPYTITASGEDIWNVPDLRGIGYHDEFHYAYKQVTAATTVPRYGGGTFTGVRISAKVESISSNTSPWAKAGVMIRQSLDPNSTHGLICITPDPCNGDFFEYRLATGDVSGPTTGGNEPDIIAPYWVGLDLDATTGRIRAYRSPDNVTWTQVGNFQIPTNPAMTLPVYVGLAVTSHNAAETCTAEFSNVSIVAGAAGAWSHQDVGIKNNVAAPLYVTLQDDATVGGDIATVTSTDSNMVLQKTWQAWDIALNDFKVNNPNLNLDKIKKITVGVRPATPNGTGTLYFDDIRLYPPRCMFGRTPDFNGDCFVDYNDLDILTDNWLLLPADPNIDLNKDTKINFKDYAIFASKWLSAALWP